MSDSKGAETLIASSSMVCIRRKELIEQLLLQLDDADPIVRQDAAIALGDLERDASFAVPHLLARLQSANVSPHDRACAAWALGRIGSSAITRQLLSVLQSTADQPEADELRRCIAEAIEQLTSDCEVMLQVARICLMSGSLKCKLIGLSLVGRLGQSRRELSAHLEPLVHDDCAVVRDAAKQVLSELA